MKRLGLCVLFSFLFLCNASASNKKDSILLKGSVYNNTDHVKDATIEIYDGNTLIKKIDVRSSNRFRTYLPANKLLTIEIDAPDFHEKRFAFDSHLPEGLVKSPVYEFDMDIFKEEELKGVNVSILDFPVGLVYYDEKKNKFIHNKSYTKKMKKEYYKLLDEAKLSERTALEKDEE
ncbi:MAG: hypothetical protein RIC95_03945 [Vicingaceae bacterium]